MNDTERAINLMIDRLEAKGKQFTDDLSKFIEDVNYMKANKENPEKICQLMVSMEKGFEMETGSLYETKEMMTGFRRIVLEGNTNG